MKIVIFVILFLNTLVGYGQTLPQVQDTASRGTEIRQPRQQEIVLGPLAQEEIQVIYEQMVELDARLQREIRKQVEARNIPFNTWQWRFKDRNYKSIIITENVRAQQQQQR